MTFPEDLPRDETTAWADFLQSETERLDGLAERIITGDESAAALIDRTGDLGCGEGRMTGQDRLAA